MFNLNFNFRCIVPEFVLVKFSTVGNGFAIRFTFQTDVCKFLLCLPYLRVNLPLFRIFSLGINNQTSFDEEIQAYTSMRCRIFGYDAVDLQIINWWGTFMQWCSKFCITSFIPLIHIIVILDRLTIMLWRYTCNVSSWYTSNN